MATPAAERRYRVLILDRAALESFISLLRKNVLDTRRWETRDELRLAIVTWIETNTTGDDGWRYSRWASPRPSWGSMTSPPASRSGTAASCGI